MKSGSAKEKRIVILLGHGVRGAKGGSLREVALSVAEMTGYPCRDCYLAMEKPSLEACLDESLAEGFDQAVVVPMFLTRGTHFEHDIPRVFEQVKQRHLKMRIQLSPHLGSGQGLAALASAQVLRALAVDNEMECLSYLSLGAIKGPLAQNPAFCRCGW